MISEQVKESLEYMIELRKSPDRIAGCPVWDKLTLDLWVKAVSGDIVNDEEFVKQTEIVMEHCKTCSHPMCNTPDLEAYKNRTE